MKSPLIVEQELYVTGRGTIFIISCDKNEISRLDETEVYTLYGRVIDFNYKVDDGPTCDILMPNHKITRIEITHPFMDKAPIGDMVGLVCSDTFEDGDLPVINLLQQINFNNS
jgi:hypothetical protein